MKIILFIFIYIISISDCFSDELKAFVRGKIVIPNNELIKLPKDFPKILETSGKFISKDNTRIKKLYSHSAVSFMSDSAHPRLTGVRLPIKGQPLQGFSGVKSLGNDEFIFIVDNGYGSKKNSPDFPLHFIKMKLNWVKGSYKIKKTSFLHDPDKKIPFLIVNEGTKKRYLTGADLDPESIQVISNRVYIGDEFGPYLIETDMSGKVIKFVQLIFQSKIIKGPDHYSLQLPKYPYIGEYQAKRSGGFEGMALGSKKKFLYPLLEAPLYDKNTGKIESNFLRIFQFDIEEKKFTNISYRYQLEGSGHAIGDFNFISENEALIIERDWGEGDISQACKVKSLNDKCFNNPAKFKRIFKVNMGSIKTDGYVKKTDFIDLLKIQDGEKVISMPFVTIENVDLVKKNHIIVANDNNYAFSSGRKIGHNDDTEIYLLEVEGL
jgi:hypothetical protein